MNERLGVAAGLGAVSGLRSMTGLAAVSRELSDRRVLWGASRLEEWLAQDLVALVLTKLAVGEIVADKLPGIPDRIAPGPLFGRALIGGILGALVVDPDERPVGAVVGAAAAIGAAYLGWLTRRELGRATLLPDPLLAVAEDAIAITAARGLAEKL